MITDMQLAVLSNVLGVCLFLLVVLYHYIVANSSSPSATAAPNGQIPTTASQPSKKRAAA